MEKTTKDLMEEKDKFNVEIDEKIRISMLDSTAKNIAIRDALDLEKQQKENDGWNSSRIRPISEREREVAEELEIVAKEEAEELMKKKAEDQLKKQQEKEARKKAAEDLKKVIEEEEAARIQAERDAIATATRLEKEAKKKALEALKVQKLKELADLENVEV